MAYQMKNSPAKIMGAIKLGSKLVKYGKSLFNKTKPLSKPKTKIKINHTKGTVTEITPTSKITRDSWPNVKPGNISDFPGTSTLPSGKVVPFDGTKTQVFKLNSNEGVRQSLKKQLSSKVKQ